uniref:Uncharacterized protein n=1 Tax=Avena sativa TaxID=4498 RepID=A0ACD5TZ98_AVESA
MEAPVSASQGAMRSLPRKLESLLSGPKHGLRPEEKKKLRTLQGDLQGLIDNYLLEPSEVESPASTASFWMKDVRDLSFDIDDFIDELAQAGTSGSRISIVQIPKLPRLRISRFPEKLKRRQWITDEISGFRTRVKEAIQRHTSYLCGCKWRPSSSRGELGECQNPPTPCSIRLVGVESSINQLCGWLANAGLPEHKVVSIVGTGGVGKTTLAKEVYRKLGGQFECRAFVRTSRKPDMKRLLTSILSQVRRHQLPDSFEPASSIEQLNYIKNALSSSLSTNASLEEIKQILNLGYDSLPHGLKACMLFLCLYEEDCVIWKDDLVKQWMAEGFVCTTEGNAGKEVAQRYFDELVNRGMIQPVDINCNDEILSCRVHHIVFHFIRYKSIEENFGIAIDHSQTAIRLADKVRRLALHLSNVKATTPAALATMRLSKVRSLAFSGFIKCMPSIVEFRFLQVLILKLWADPDNRGDNLVGSDDLSGNNLVGSDDLSGNITEPDDLTDNLAEPDDLRYNLTAISELFRLRYFHLDAYDVSVELPTEMQRLKDLVAWEIDAEVTAVPSDIVDLLGLFYLSIPSKARLPTGIGRMSSLRTLGVIDLSMNSTEIVMSLGELTNLQDLFFTCSTLQPDNLEKNLECLGLIIRKLSNLRCVTLVPAVSSRINIHDDAGASSMSISWHVFIIEPLSPALQRLELSRRCCVFSSLPEWINGLTKLCVLKIALRKMSSEDFAILKALPSLAALSLFVWASPVRRIMFDHEGFPVLKYFKFVCHAPCLAFMDGAMPRVQNLKLGFNANRMERYSLVAAGLEHLTGLNVISTKNGGAGADECDRRSVNSVLTDAISKHPSTLIINVQWVDWKFCGDSLEEGSKKQANTRIYALPESTSHLPHTESHPPPSLHPQPPTQLCSSLIPFFFHSLVSTAPASYSPASQTLPPPRPCDPHCRVVVPVVPWETAIFAYLHPAMAATFGLERSACGSPPAPRSSRLSAVPTDNRFLLVVQESPSDILLSAHSLTFALFSSPFGLGITDTLHHQYKKLSNSSAKLILITSA